MIWRGHEAHLNLNLNLWAKYSYFVMQCMNWREKEEGGGRGSGKQGKQCKVISPLFCPSSIWLTQIDTHQSRGGDVFRKGFCKKIIAFTKVTKSSVLVAQMKDLIEYIPGKLIWFFRCENFLRYGTSKKMPRSDELQNWTKLRKMVLFDTFPTVEKPTHRTMP